MLSNTCGSRFATAVATLLIGYPTTGVALEPVSSAQLADRCRAFLERPTSDQGRYCLGYVTGFIEGSTSVVIRGTHPTDPTESFSQRAVRTRLGRQAPARPTYCIDRSVAIKTLVEQIVALAEKTRTHDDSKASVLIYATLARFYGC